MLRSRGVPYLSSPLHLILIILSTGKVNYLKRLGIMLAVFIHCCQILSYLNSLYRVSYRGKGALCHLETTLYKVEISMNDM